MTSRSYQARAKDSAEPTKAEPLQPSKQPKTLRMEQAEPGTETETETRDPCATMPH